MTNLDKSWHGPRHLVKGLVILFSISVLASCGGINLKDEIERDPPTYASAPSDQGILAKMASDIYAEHSPHHSGFKLLDSSLDGLTWRLALIDSAVSSLDIQTYLWYPDEAGVLILTRAIQAADRGVRVRLVVDDLLTIGQEQLIYELHNRPNVETRLFNPWKDRSTLSRAGEMIAQFERLNTRMHDKLMIVDGHAAVVGGRNLGDHYFGLSDAYNFHDLDVLGFGELALQSNAMFDHFWNSEWVVSAGNLETEHDPEFVKQKTQDIRTRLQASEKLKAVGIAPRDWTAELTALAVELHPGTSFLIYDTADAEQINQIVAGEMFGFLDLATEELLITNAYIIPGQPIIDFIKSKADAGVRVRILTNSLESHDVPAVNSHYEGWRDDFINAGAELFELRADPEIQSLVDIPPTQSEFTGLHTKAVVVDRSKAFIGSMNFDPRSVNINTEAGAFIDSPGLASELADVMNRDMQPGNAWQVMLDDKGEPYWVNSDETVGKQPARGSSQRIMNTIFKMFPEEQY